MFKEQASYCSINMLQGENYGLFITTERSIGVFCGKNILFARALVLILDMTGTVNQAVKRPK